MKKKDLEDKNSLDYAIKIIKEYRDLYIKWHESPRSRKDILSLIKKEESPFENESAEARFNAMMIPSKKTILMQREREIDGKICIENDYFFVGNEEDGIVFVKLSGDEAGKIIRPGPDQVELSFKEGSYGSGKIKILKFPDGYSLEYCEKFGGPSSYSDYFYVKSNKKETAYYNPTKPLYLSRYMSVADFNDNREITKVADQIQEEF